jgi:tRNA threonylcarbamoyladenosine biosynthesis protein TsaB
VLVARILAVETSSNACSVALLLSDQVCAEQRGSAVPYDAEVQFRYQLAHRDHTHLVLPMVDDLLTANGLALTELDAIAFGCGPGSFTGLRISAGVAQGLAFAAQLPVVSVSSLAAVAHAALAKQAATGDCRVLVCVDARMGEVYIGAYDNFGTYQRAGAGEMLSAGLEECLVAPQDWCLTQWLRPSAQHLALGSGWQFMDQISAAAEVPWGCVDTEALPHAVDIAWLGLRAWQRGEVLLPHQAEPVYLREQVAWRQADTNGK